MFRVIILVIFSLFFQACKKDSFELLWQKVETNTTESLYSLNIINNELVIFGGATYNIGKQIKISLSNEQLIANDSIAPKAIYSSYFLDANYGRACGYDGKIYFTENSGNSWSILQTSSWRALQSIHYNYGWGIAVGGLGNNEGAIQVNYDTVWQWKEFLIDRELRSVYITDSTTAFAVGNGIMLKTTDKGIVWSPINVDGDLFTDIQFVTPQIGYVLGYSGLLFKTTNSGKTWQKIKIQKSILNRTYLNALYFINEQTGFICGNNGIILKTTNGGNTWLQAKNISSENLYNIIIDSTTNKGYACGTNGTLLSFSL